VANILYKNQNLKDLMELALLKPHPQSPSPQMWTGGEVRITTVLSNPMDPNSDINLFISNSFGEDPKLKMQNLKLQF